MLVRSCKKCFGQIISCEAAEARFRKPRDSSETKVGECETCFGCSRQMLDKPSTDRTRNQSGRPLTLNPSSLSDAFVADPSSHTSVRSNLNKATLICSLAARRQDGTIHFKPKFCKPVQPSLHLEEELLGSPEETPRCSSYQDALVESNKELNGTAVQNSLNAPNFNLMLSSDLSEASINNKNRMPSHLSLSSNKYMNRIDTNLDLSELFRQNAELVKFHTSKAAFLPSTSNCDQRRR